MRLFVQRSSHSSAFLAGETLLLRLELRRFLCKKNRKLVFEFFAMASVHRRVSSIWPKILFRVAAKITGNRAEYRLMQLSNSDGIP